MRSALRNNRQLGFIARVLAACMLIARTVGLIAPTPSAAQAVPTTYIVNRSPFFSIDKVEISPARSWSWRSGVPEEPSRQRFRVVLYPGKCLYDVKVDYSLFRDERWHIRQERLLNEDLCATPEFGVFGPTLGTLEFDLVNKSTKTVVRMFVAPAKELWGKDQLTGTIAPGGRHLVVLVHEGYCRYCIKIDYSDGTTEERHEIDLCRPPIEFDGSSQKAQ